MKRIARKLCQEKKIIHADREPSKLFSHRMSFLRIDGEFVGGKLSCTRNESCNAKEIQEEILNSSLVAILKEAWNGKNSVKTAECQGNRRMFWSLPVYKDGLVVEGSVYIINTSTLDKINTPIMIIDQSGKIQYASPTMLKTFGECRLEDVLLNHVNAYICSSEVIPFWDGLRRADTSKKPNLFKTKIKSKIKLIPFVGVQIPLIANYDSLGFIVFGSVVSDSISKSLQALPWN